MNKLHTDTHLIHGSWDDLQGRFNLTDYQRDQCKRYAQLLLEWNMKFNLTAIVDESAIIQHHFYDSLAISESIDFTSVTTFCDVGTGAGFPGMPLSIMFPHLMTILIEVNQKKRQFLKHVVEQLALEKVVISPLDWITFLRKTEYRIDYVFARASLQPYELVRMFKPASPYKHATLVYWASEKWNYGAYMQNNTRGYTIDCVPYTIDGIQRKYIFFKAT